MAITLLVKDPLESLTYQMSFSLVEEIVQGDTLASVNSVTFTPTGLTYSFVDAFVSADLKSVFIPISGGAEGTTYLGTFVVTTVGGSTLVGRGKLLCTAAC